MTSAAATNPHEAPAPPLLSMRRIEKAFPGVKALRGVDLELRPGEILALLGENGAGKSTLIKVLAGAHRPDGGCIRIDGKDPGVSTPADALRAGVAVIYQEFNLVPSLTVTDNIFLGHEDATVGFVRRREQHRRACKLFDRIGVAIDPDARCGELTVAQQQIVEIAKALALDARILVMDEPSATLTSQEVEHLFEMMRELRSQGIGIIYISHRLDEIFAVADRVMVLRDGAHVSTEAIEDVTRDGLIEAMVGRRLENEFPKESCPIGERRFVVSDLEGDQVYGVSFSVRRGEVVALTGLVGSGRTETLRLIFGADRRRGGSVELDGRRLSISNPRDAIRSGICLLTEDRKASGLVLTQSVRENFGLPNLKQLSHLGFVSERQERNRLNRFIDSLQLRVSHVDQYARDLSGGNQQKVVLAKWLERNCEVLLFDEPTRGIDIGAKYEIYLLINELAAQGKAIVMVSSELPEVLGMADRIIVMHDGRVCGEISDVEHATQEDIMRLAVQ